MTTQTIEIQKALPGFDVTFKKTLDSQIDMAKNELTTAMGLDDQVETAIQKTIIDYKAKKVKHPANKSIKTDGIPKGQNPVFIEENAKLLQSSIKLDAMHDAFIKVNEADQKLKLSQSDYIEKYYQFGLLAIEYKQSFKLEHNKSVSDEKIAQAYNVKFPNDSISRVFVCRARLLAEKYLNLNDTERKAIIDGKPIKKENAEKSESKAKKDSLDILTASLEKVKKEYGTIDMILDTVIPSLIELFGKDTVKNALVEYLK